MAISFQHQL